MVYSLHVPDIAKEQLVGKHLIGTSFKLGSPKSRGEIKLPQKITHARLGTEHNNMACIWIKLEAGDETYLYEHETVYLL